MCPAFPPAQGAPHPEVCRWLFPPLQLWSMPGTSPGQTPGTKLPWSRCPCQAECEGQSITQIFKGWSHGRIQHHWGVTTCLERSSCFLWLSWGSASAFHPLAPSPELSVCQRRHRSKERWFPNFIIHQNQLQSLLQQNSCWCSRFWVRPLGCISQEFPGDTDAVCLGTVLWGPWCRSKGSNKSYTCAH